MISKSKRVLSLVLTLCLALSLLTALSISAVAAELPFTDVPASAWYYADVKTAYESGLINGSSATTYSPNNNLTYAEAIKLAACMHQLYTTKAVTLTNGSPAWYQSYVDYAKENNIIAKDYEWTAQATRAGYMEIFAGALPAEALAAVNALAEGSIPDVAADHPSAAAIYALYRAGIVQGVDAEHNCNPAANIVRSEVAAILTRMMDSDKRVRFEIRSDGPQSPVVTLVTPASGALSIKNADETFSLAVIFFFFGLRSGQITLMRGISANTRRRCLSSSFASGSASRIYA